MASQIQINAFIKQIAPCAQKAYKALGKVLPSICIAMACVESAYGTAGSCKHHSYMGQKVGTGKTATKYWGGAFFTSKTSEEYTVGVHTVIKSAFRAYDSMEQCVFNYYELLNTSLYKLVTSGVDYETQMKQIKAAGYMTSSTEVNSVISIIEKYGLTQYDGVAGGSSAQVSSQASSQASAQAAGDTFVMEVTAGRLNLRQTPGTGGQIIAVMEKGDCVAANGVTQVKDSITWCYVAFGLVTGWASAKYLKRV